MGWSWDQFEDAPKWVVDALLAKVQREHEEREAKAQAEKMARDRGAGRM